MKPREILIYYAIIHEGNWDKIYEALALNEDFDEKEAKRIIANPKSSVVTIFDDDYPQQLKFITKPPFVLFYHGDLSIIKDKYKAVSVVGARENTKYGEDVTNYFVKNLCKEFINNPPAIARTRPRITYSIAKPLPKKDININIDATSTIGEEIKKEISK